jgi:hypothetical protein
MPKYGSGMLHTHMLALVDGDVVGEVKKVKMPRTGDQMLMVSLWTR